MLEAARVIYSGYESQVSDRSDTWHAHEALQSRFGVNEVTNVAIDSSDLRRQMATDFGQFGDQAAHHRMPCSQFLGALDQCVLVARSKDQAERLQYAADLSVEFAAHRHELMTGAEYCPALVRSDALGMHLAIPAHPQHVGQASGIAAVRFSRPDRQRGVGMSCIHADDRQTCRGQRVK